MRRHSGKGTTPSLSRSSVLTALLAVIASAIEFKPVPQPSLNFDDLGKVGLAGDFDAISVYAYDGQGVSTLNQNGSDSVMVQLPNGGLSPVVAADANIEAMCTFQLKNGTVVGIMVGGNFTSLGGVQADGIAIMNPDNGDVTPLSGLTGKVNALLCDTDAEMVYVGGEFTGANSSNALAWTTSGWKNLPFEGFNKPVKTIIKADGSIIFGGFFDGLGNITAPAASHTQTLNLQSAEIKADQTIQREGFSNPRSIICNNGQDGPGSTWLMGDGQFGSWSASFRFGFRPTKLRLRNTHFEGRGTAEFRFTAFPIGGIMNLTYVDPVDGRKKFCESRCPLSEDPEVEFQDFEFVNVIGMNEFRLDVSRFYGAGGGLAGIEVFQDDVFTFAINDFNEPSCSNEGLISSSEVQGEWKTVSSQTDSEYLSATLLAESAGSLSVTFFPDIQQSGNYSVLVYTPGCLQDGTCGSRGRVTLSGTYKRGQKEPIVSEIFQTNNFDKYDIIYTAEVDASRDGFRPSVTLTASPNQARQLTFVAQKIRFDLISNTTQGLNGLYEFVPGDDKIENFRDSVYVQSSEELKSDAQVYTLATQGSSTYAGGNFTSESNGDGYNHILEITEDGPVSLARKGLNGVVWTLLVSQENKLFVGGEFTNTVDGDTSGINNIAVYDTESDSWSSLGDGVNGRVKDLVPMSLSISGEDTSVIAVSGDFTELRSTNDKGTESVEGFAIWVPSKNEWLVRLDEEVIELEGNLSAVTSVPDGNTFFSGSASTFDMLASGAVTVESKDKISLQQLPIKFLQTAERNSTVTKRAIPVNETEGVVTGVFYREEDLDLTIIGGHFTVEGKNGEVNNLAIINHKADNEVTGLNGMDSDGTIVALHANAGMLYAGGAIRGRIGQFDIGGVLIYDLKNGKLADNQPAGIQGGEAIVRSIATQPDSKKVFVAGSFASAGSFSCPSLCIYESDNRQWTRPGAAVEGTINNIQWVNVDELLAVGDMTINGTTTYVAKYNAKYLYWETVGAEGNTIPGPVTAISLDSNQETLCLLPAAPGTVALSL